MSQSAFAGAQVACCIPYWVIILINEHPYTLEQAFINQSFENITSIEHSLKLLHKFQSILQRESLKSDLDSKLNIIFQVHTTLIYTFSGWSFTD